MPLFLKERDRSAREFMDDPECDPETLVKTYRQFTYINLLLARWNIIYRDHILSFYRIKKRPVTILDIGFGGGDILRSLAKWSARDRIELQLTGIETDSRAVAYARSISTRPSIRLMQTSSGELLGSGARFDFVISNHLLHHLDEKACLSLMDEARRLSTHKVLFNDIERSDSAYLLFNLFRPLFNNSYIIPDGFTSIKRSYTFRELKNIVPRKWKVSRIFPYRLLLCFQHE